MVLDNLPYCLAILGNLTISSLKMGIFPASHYYSIFSIVLKFWFIKFSNVPALFLNFAFVIPCLCVVSSVIFP